MLCILLTSDYELHGNGDGDPMALMVEPTRRMLDQFDRFGARLTIFADVAEILRFRDHRDHTGSDDFHVEAIENQLRDAIARGHDVQLHLHCSWFGAHFEGGRWHQDWRHYSFADLPGETMDNFVAAGKAWLESLLRPIDPTYRCEVFRAANWSMQPSAHAVRVLKRHGFRIDSSVFKWGIRSGLVEFDYSQAAHSTLPWPVADHDICQTDPQSSLWEFPIHAEHRRLSAFLSPTRLHRAWLSRCHRLPRFSIASTRPTAPLRRSLAHQAAAFLGRHSWKADFNQCTGRQLIASLIRTEKALSAPESPPVAPFVLIGHSKLFTRWNERGLEPFLSFVASTPDRFGFARYADLLPGICSSRPEKAIPLSPSREATSKSSQEPLACNL